MAATSSQPKPRPLSPHLSHLEVGAAHAGVDPPPHHRQRLAVLGLALLTWWLWALAAGPEAYADIHRLTAHAGTG